MEEVFTNFSITINDSMNVAITKEIIERDIGAVVRDMTKGKVLGHDGLSIEFFSKTMTYHWGGFSQNAAKYYRGREFT